jgi:hypothetical protein
MKKTFWLAILSILLALALSGCWHEVFEFYHFPDGSGRLVIRSEITQDVLALDDEVSSMEEIQDDLLESVSREGDFSADHPNIAAVSVEDYIDPVTGSFNYVTEVDVINMLESFFDDDELEESFVFSSNPDGTYRFSALLELGKGEWWPDEESAEYEEFRPIFEEADFTLILHVYDFIEGDPQAVYDPAEKTVTWSWPMSEILSKETDQELWAVYRVDAPEMIDEEPEIEVPAPIIVEDVAKPASPEVPLPPPAVVQPQQDDGFLGLPNWVPFVLGGLFCLSLVAVVVVVIVVFVLKKRKNPSLPPNLD